MKAEQTGGNELHKASPYCQNTILTVGHSSIVMAHAIEKGQVLMPIVINKKILSANLTLAYLNLVASVFHWRLNVCYDEVQGVFVRKTQNSPATYSILALPR